MASDSTTRRIEKFSFSGHSGRVAVDYLALFTFLHKTSPEKRRWTSGRKVVMIPKMRRTKDYFFFTATEGEKGVAPTIQNTDTAEERVEKLGAGEAVIDKAHGLIDPEGRVAVIEYVRRGAKVKDIKAVLEEAGRTDPRWPELEITFAPVPQAEFYSAINAYDRIREAQLTLARPNPGWTDQKKMILGIGEKSNAKAVNLGAVAPLGESLAKDEGVVAIIKEEGEQEHTTMTDAKIKGTRAEDARESTISLKKYVEQATVRVDTDENGQVVEADMQDKLLRFLQGRLRQEDDD